MALTLIGAGLGRTGTLSLKLALEQLGLGRCHHMAEVFGQPERVPLWVEAAKGRPDWEAIYEGYGAAVDYPTCTFWRELAEAYPDAKVLLSVRDADAWFDSTQSTIFSEANVELCRKTPIPEFFELTVFRDFGDRLRDRAFMTDYFHRWNETVRAAIPADRLLVYEVKQGWEPLCAFLGLPVPDEPFPRSNSREELSARINEALETGERPSGNLLDEARAKQERAKSEG